MSETKWKSQGHSDDLYQICPYCGNQAHVEAADFDEHERVEECESCGSTYLAYDEFTVTHHTRPHAP